MQVLDHEISVWKRLRHPRILEFYGACSVADPPVFVCALKECDATSYVLEHKDANKAELVSSIARPEGLFLDLCFGIAVRRVPWTGVFA